MALQCDPPYLGDIGDRGYEPGPDIDAEYEAWAQQRREAACAAAEAAGGQADG